MHIRDADQQPGAGHGHDIYASLPRSLKKEVLVRSKIEEDENVLKERQAIVSTKTPAELSQIHSFAEVPLPRQIESWLHHSEGGAEASRYIVHLSKVVKTVKTKIVALEILLQLLLSLKVLTTHIKITT